MRKKSIKRYFNELIVIIHSNNIHLIIDYESIDYFLDDLKVNMKHLLIPPVRPFYTDYLE